MTRSRSLAIVHVGLLGCTMPNPAFDPHGLADESIGEAESQTELDTSPGDGDGDGDPSGDGDGDPGGEGDGDSSGDGDGDGDGDGCGAGELLCDGACVVPNTNEHCGSCDACEGECIDQVCTQDHVMFLTNAYFLGDLGGIEGANAVCQLAADAGVVPTGDYIAWLGAEAYTPASYFGPGSRFVRPDGQVIAASLADLLDGNVDVKIIVTEFNMFLGLGQDCTPYALVWTGLTPSGEPTADNCQNWTSPLGAGGTGFSHATDGNWAMSVACNQGVSGCAEARKLYCVQL